MCEPDREVSLPIKRKRPANPICRVTGSTGKMPWEVTHGDSIGVISINGGTRGEPGER
jgi:hypothetical protein